MKKSEISISTKVVLDENISRITCFAEKCYFNQSYKGEFSCDLKNIEIDSTGQCVDFCDRHNTAKFIRGEHTEK